jgi:hypothetical protein
MTVAAIFFGTIRLRTPYDPYAIILAVEAWAVVIIGIAMRRRRSRSTHAAAAPDANDAGSATGSRA